MKQILKVQLLYALMLAWIMGTMWPLAYGVFHPDSLVPWFGIAFFFLFMYPGYRLGELIARKL